MKNICGRPLCIMLVIVLSSCENYKVEEFTTNEIKWFKPYYAETKVIFLSERNEVDTILFHKVVRDSDSIRSYERGYYNVNYLSVPYEFSKGSYHQFAWMSDGKHRYDDYIFSMSKQSSGSLSFQVSFIGLIFDDYRIRDILPINSNAYFFDGKKANYSGMNTEKGINSFWFSTKLGVTGYIDDRGIKWGRK